VQETTAPNEPPGEQVDIVEGEAVVATVIQREGHKKHGGQEGERAQLAESRRRRIFKSLVALELQGFTCSEACVVVAKQYGISVETAGEISIEGAEKGWPKQ
jgi:hypothetical protein